MQMRIVAAAGKDALMLLLFCEKLVGLFLPKLTTNQLLPRGCSQFEIKCAIINNRGNCKRIMNRMLGISKPLPLFRMFSATLSPTRGFATRKQVKKREIIKKTHDDSLHKQHSRSDEEESKKIRPKKKEKPLLSPESPKPIESGVSG